MKKDNTLTGMIAEQMGAKLSIETQLFRASEYGEEALKEMFEESEKELNEIQKWCQAYRLLSDCQKAFSKCNKDALSISALMKELNNSASNDAPFNRKPFETELSLAYQLSKIGISTRLFMDNQEAVDGYNIEDFTPSEDSDETFDELPEETEDCNEEDSDGEFGTESSIIN